MSKEYVTKEKVIETILNYGIGWGSARVRGVINNIPAADVVEVVRCGQCKYWKQRENREYGLCAKHRGVWLNSDFCSKGECKNGGQDE